MYYIYCKDFQFIIYTYINSKIHQSILDHQIAGIYNKLRKQILMSVNQYYNGVKKFHHLLFCITPVNFTKETEKGK